METETQVVDEEQAQEEFLKRFIFRDLTESRVDVRTKCAHCKGEGTKGGEECPVCGGDKVVVQSMSLYNLTMKQMPLIVHELKDLMLQISAAQEQASGR